MIAERTGRTSHVVFVADPEGISWTETGSYTNVAISAFLSTTSSNGNDGTGTVYLTNMIGPGTTSANQIAETTVSGLGRQPNTATDLFSGLSLGPGTYYLITASNLGGGGLGWEGFIGNTANMDTGVTINPDEFHEGAEATYPPASTFFTNGDTSFDFQVTGNAIPEPATLPLAGIALVLGSLILVRRRRSFASELSENTR